MRRHGNLRQAFLWSAAASALASAATAGTLVCPGTPPVISLSSPTAGDTTGKANSASTYDCLASTFGGPGPKSGFTGPEDVYQFTTTSDAVVAFQLVTSNPDLRLFLLQSCDEASCISEGGCGENIAPGTWLLVVDGLNGAAGPYTIQPVVLAAQTPRNRWYDCPEGFGQSPDTSRLRTFNFDSGNFCGTGCDFSLYAVVGCGSEMHLPFFDVETGHSQVYDVFQGRFVDLVATNRVAYNAGLPATCEYTDSGPAVQWQDNTCTAIPCPTGNCGGGSDCRTNNVVMDLSFLGAPLLCGVYRLDLDSWGGFVWEVHANCSADRSEQFYLYRDLCSALVDFRSLPEIGIAAFTFDESGCASEEVRGTVTLENAGCADAAEVVIEIDEPAAPHPLRLTAAVASGKQVTLPWTYSVANMPVTLRLSVDPGNELAECSENIGATVSCGSSASLAKVLDFEACDPVCAAHADAGALSTVCPGNSVRLDAGGSLQRCAAPAVVEYRWEDRAGNPIPGCDWQSSPLCSVPPALLPLGKSHYTVRTRCQGAAKNCDASAETAVVVTDANTLPASLGNVLLAARASDDARFSARTPSADVISGYRLYRDRDPRLPGPTRVLAASEAPDAAALVDIGAVSGAPPLSFYQLVAVSCQGDLEGPY